ncbi:hypothetical protein SprV_0802596400 [Sparganum proliferum]
MINPVSDEVTHMKCSAMNHYSYRLVVRRNGTVTQCQTSAVQPGLRRPAGGHGDRFLLLQVCFIQQQKEQYQLKDASEEQQTSVKHDSVLSIHAAL